MSDEGTFERWSKEWDAIMKMFEKTNMPHYSTMLLEHTKKYNEEWNYGTG